MPFWQRGWWTRVAHHREVVFAYIGIALACAAGWQATSVLAHRENEHLQAQVSFNQEQIAVNQATIDAQAAAAKQLCDELQDDRRRFRLFVSDLMEGARPDTRVRVLSRLDDRTPEERICGRPVANLPDPAPALPPDTTMP